MQAVGEIAEIRVSTFVKDGFESYPDCRLFCENCGYMRLFSAQAIRGKSFPPKEPPDKEKAAEDET
jgi:hypothetical protein